MNHVNVDEVEAQQDAVIGKFLVKSFTAIVLFDTGCIAFIHIKGICG